MATQRKVREEVLNCRMAFKTWLSLTIKDNIGEEYLGLLNLTKLRNDAVLPEIDNHGKSLLCLLLSQYVSIMRR